MRGNDGKLYGTTVGQAAGYGTIFSISQDGTAFSTLHVFASDGANPYAGLVEGGDGKLYGTTVGGG